MSWRFSRNRAGATPEPDWRDRHQFLRDLPDGVRARVPADLRGFNARVKGGLAQLDYGDPAIHFEAWFHWRTSRLELGLHLEKARSENERLFLGLDRRIVEIKCELGESIELERWDKGWARLYETWPCQKVDRPFQEQMTTRLARLVSVLQPMVAETIDDVWSVSRV